jgi:hypothetical protein
MGELVLSNFANSPQFQELLKQEIEKESDEFVAANIDSILQSTIGSAQTRRFFSL